MRLAALGTAFFQYRGTETGDMPVLESWRVAAATKAPRGVENVHGISIMRLRFVDAGIHHCGFTVLTPVYLYSWALN